MIKKKTKAKTAPKTVARKKGKAAGKDQKKELDSLGTWKEVAMLVESHAMAEAVIEEGEKGQVSPVKFLFEVAKIGPPPEGTDTTEGEESLAKTLFRTLNIPMTLAATDQNDEEDTVVIPANASVQKDGEKGKDKSAEPQKVGI